MTTAVRFIHLQSESVTWAVRFASSQRESEIDQISEVHLSLQWETWPDQWGSPMSTMGDMTRSVRVTYVYNGRHNQISEGHLCLQWETWPDQWGSPMSTMGDRFLQKQWSSPVHRGSQSMTRWVRFTCLEETDWPKPWGSPVHIESQRLTQQTKCMVKLTSTDLFSTALMKSLNSLKGVPGPHRPNRVM